MEKRFNISVAASDLKITPAAVARNFGGSRYRPDPGSQHRIEESIQAAQGLIEPAAVFGLHPVKTVTSRGRILLENGLQLDLPCPPGNNDIKYLAAAVATLGPRLEQACRRLSAAGKVYKATLLDAVGTCQLEVLADRGRRRLQKEARRENMFCGIRFAPGLNGFDLTRQSILFKLADTRRIGVRLNPDCVMSPVKSVSMAMLFTTEPMQNGVYHKCSHCDLKDCQFRAI
jgi:hypothetical protein